MAASPSTRPPLACGGPAERRPTSLAGRNSLLLAIADEAPDGGPPFVKLLRIGRKNQGVVARVLGLLLTRVAAKAVWTAMRLDF